MTDAQLVLFLFSSIAVIMIPGQDLVLVLSRGIAQGVKAGIVTAAGVSVGLVGHTLLTAFGLGALLMSSALFFAVIKYIGAAYLVYLGVNLLRSTRQGLAIEKAKDISFWRAFLTGAASNISNPKITIFYLAFLPQFVTAETQNPTLLLFVLGITFAALTFAIKLPFGYFAGKSSHWLQQRPKVIAWMDRVSGSILVALGIRLALQSNSDINE